MGNNTVAFICNDIADSISKSPKTTIDLIRICTSSGKGSNDPVYHNSLLELARSHGEPPLHDQALEILPCFHSSETKYFLAGGNRIKELEIKHYRKCSKTGRQTVTLFVDELAKPQRIK